MSAEKMTPEGLLYAGIVLLGLVIIYNTIMTAIKNHMEAKKRRDTPVDTLTARVDAHDQMLARDKRRIDEMDERLSSVSDQSTIMLRGVRALLSHELNGNSIDKLESSMTEIDDYLIARK